MPSFTSTAMRATSSGVAARSYAASPMTYRRSGEWPTYAVKFSSVPRRATVSRYSGNVSKSHSIPSARVSTSMSSTFSSVRAMTSWCSALVGAMAKPQLPATTVVTP